MISNSMPNSYNCERKENNEKSNSIVNNNQTNTKNGIGHADAIALLFGKTNV